jgi:RNA polymerase sigma-70 factor (ECF subfamily)
MPNQPPENWDDLLAASRGGDAVAIARLLLATRSYLRLVAEDHDIRPLRSKLSESDLVQESLLEIARDLPSRTTTPADEFVRWTERVLLHNLVDAKRRFLAAQQRDVRREVSLDAAEHVFTASPNISSVVRRVERDELLEQSIAALPDNYQQVLQLRHEQGLAWEAVGAQLGISAEAARKLWARAVQRLQQQLDVRESDGG